MIERTNPDDIRESFSDPGFYHARIKDWPESERPREKLLKHGPEALSNAELLAILIQSGTGNITALDLAKTMLTEFSGLPGLARRSISEVKRFKGIGDARAAVIAAGIEFARRLQAEPEEAYQVSGPEDVARRFIPRLRDQKVEYFYTILLNNAGKIISEHVISQGTINASLVHQREVFHHAVTELAASVILLHNHPSGTLEASAEDKNITEMMVRAGEIMDIPVRDHIIIAGNRYLSFAEKGLLY